MIEASCLRELHFWSILNDVLSRRSSYYAAESARHSSNFLGNPLWFFFLSIACSNNHFTFFKELIEIARSYQVSFPFCLFDTWLAFFTMKLFANDYQLEAVSELWPWSWILISWPSLILVHIPFITIVDPSFLFQISSAMSTERIK